MLSGWCRTTWLRGITVHVNVFTEWFRWWHTLIIRSCEHDHWSRQLRQSLVVSGFEHDHWIQQLRQSLVISSFEHDHWIQQLSVPSFIILTALLSKNKFISPVRLKNLNILANAQFISNVLLHTLLWYESDFISFLFAKYNLARLSPPKHVIMEYMPHAWTCM